MESVSGGPCVPILYIRVSIQQNGAQKPVETSKVAQRDMAVEVTCIEESKSKLCTNVPKTSSSVANSKKVASKQKFWI